MPSGWSTSSRRTMPQTTPSSVSARAPLPPGRGRLPPKPTRCWKRDSRRARSWSRGAWRWARRRGGGGSPKRPAAGGGGGGAAKHEAARAALEQAVIVSPSDSRAWVALARARDASGDRAGALDAYARGVKDGGADALRPEAALGYGRLLTQEKRWSEARGTLERLMKSDDTAVVAAASSAIGETYQGEGDNLAAAEYYMTAAYVAPESPVGRRGLLAAGASFTA